MALDIRGSLKKAKFNNNYYIFIDELFANAVDSFLIRQNQSDDDLVFKAAFNVEFYNLDLEENEIGFSLSCFDNGVGLGNEQTKAFVTKDTSYKDDLNIEGIGKCKGSGRIQYLRYFSKIEIKSIFLDENTLYRRGLNIDDSYKEIDEETFTFSEVDSGEIGFEIKLDGLKEDAKSNICRHTNIKQAFSADELRKHILVRFLQRLVTLKDQLGDFRIDFQSSYDGEIEGSSLVCSDLPEVTACESVALPSPNSTNNSDIEFKISHYKLAKKEYNLVKNTVALCAKSAIVADITKKYLRSKTLENNEIDGQYHIVLVESLYLDDHVNEQRDGYDLPKSSTDKDQETFLENKISMEEIYDVIEDKIIEMISPPGWNKEEVVAQVEDVFKALELSPEDLAEVVDYIKSSADNQQGYHERRLEELHKELITVKRRISRLTDLFVDGDIDKDTHEERRAELIKERDDIMFEIEQSNTADDNFTNTLIGTVEVASGAYDTFKVGTFEQKRRLLNFVFDHLELKGSTLCYSLKKPFDRFVNLSKIEEWRARKDSNPQPPDP